jgi:hypothetical protein
VDPTEPHRRMVRSFMELLADAQVDDDTLSQGASTLLDGAGQALDLCLALMARGIVGIQDHQRAAFGAMVTGALVEMGADPAPATLALTTVLGRVLPPMNRLHQGADPEQDLEAVSAWEAMGTLYRPAVAILSPSANARDLARGQLGELTHVLRHHEQGGAYVWRLLRVLDETAMIVRHESGSARLRISGVADNLQLQVLLMEALSDAGVLEVARPEPDWLAVARGSAPQQACGTVIGAWNLASPQGDVPLDGDPAEIPQVDGQRVLLLHDADPPPRWHNGRMFAALPASVTVEEVM